MSISVLSHDISISVYFKYKNFVFIYKKETGEINFDKVFYLVQYIHNFIIFTYNLYKIIDEIFAFFFTQFIVILKYN